MPACIRDLISDSFSETYVDVARRPTGQQMVDASTWPLSLPEEVTLAEGNDNITLDPNGNITALAYQAFHSGTVKTVYTWSFRMITKTA